MSGKQWRPCSIWSGSSLFTQACLSQYLGLLLLNESATLQPLYNTVCYITVLDITWFKDGSQKCIIILKNVHKCSFFNIIYTFCLDITQLFSQPQWLSWMRRRTGDQEVAGSTPAEVGNILSWRLIMKYFLRSFSPFSWFKKGSCQFLAKECAQYWLTA